MTRQDSPRTVLGAVVRAALFGLLMGAIFGVTANKNPGPMNALFTAGFTALIAAPMMKRVVAVVYAAGFSLIGLLIVGLVYR